MPQRSLGKATPERDATVVMRSIGIAIVTAQTRPGRLLEAGQWLANVQVNIYSRWHPRWWQRQRQRQSQSPGLYACGVALIKQSERDTRSWISRHLPPRCIQIKCTDTIADGDVEADAGCWNPGVQTHTHKRTPRQRLLFGGRGIRSTCSRKVKTGQVIGYTRLVPFKNIVIYKALLSPWKT